MTGIGLIPYMCIVVDSDAVYDGQVQFCKIVKVNTDYVSEVIEIGSIIVKCPRKLYDEIITFISGRKKMLIEKVFHPKSKSFKKFEIFDFEKGDSFFYLKTNVNKLIMSNRNSYYVLAG